MSEARRLLDLILPVGIVACLMVILVPLPAGVLDILLAANITIAVIILLTTIQIRTPLEFGIFPTLLLGTVLLRVVLNIATTRLILSKGATENSAAAGGVIQSFGEFVAGNQITVGIVIFAIIVVVQFVVITKGATRISEVAARFNLDGMPGRQMAIDADLNAKIIDAQEAGRRRAALQEQSEFYGAMDGASKFVRGDAIAGIVITMINIVGGLTIGLMSGMSVGQAAETFTMLTIGDGLASQVPGLLISLAAGILISRTSRSTNLPSEFIDQLFSRPQVLVIAGGFLFALVFTQLPAVPLLLVGGTCVAVAMMLPGSQEKSKPETESQPLDPAQIEKKKEQKINRLLAVDPIEIELGVQLIQICNDKGLLQHITRAREAMASELGIVLPKVRVRDNLNLEPNQFQIRINQFPVGQGTIDAERVLIVKKTPAAADPAGTAAPWHFGFGAFWVEPDSVATRAREYYQLSPPQVIVESLKQQSRIHAAEILTRQSTAYLIDQLRESNPATVDELIPGKMSIGQVQQILQRLLREGLSIRPLNHILESLADSISAGTNQEPGPLDIADLVESVRVRLAAWITAATQTADGRVRVIEMDAELSAWLQSRITVRQGDRHLQLEIEELQRIQEQLTSTVAALESNGQSSGQSSGQIPGEPVSLLVPRPLRAALAAILVTRFGSVPVVCRDEVISETKIETIAILRFRDVHYAAA